MGGKGRHIRYNWKQTVAKYLQTYVNYLTVINYFVAQSQCFYCSLTNHVINLSTTRKLKVKSIIQMIQSAKRIITFGISLLSLQLIPTRINLASHPSVESRYSTIRYR